VAIYHRDCSKGFDFIHEVVESGCKCGDDAISEANAALIVAAVNALPDLLARLDSLAGELAATNAGWQRTYDHDCALLNARAESAERERDALAAELARVREALFVETAMRVMPDGPRDFNPNEKETVVDLHCSCGRVTRHLIAAKPKGEL
jgi:hypothetical protein